jgi:hypothetical protein
MHTGSSIQRTLAILILTVGAAALLLIATPAWAQSFRGSIRGTVTDPSGSVIAGAKVSAKNIGTGQQREATTGADGGYVLAELPAGEYTVTAESAGLSPAAQNVQVNVGLDTTANFDLTKVEKRAEQLTVTAEAPVIETTRDVLGQVVERQLVNELPLNGRDFGKLVALTPGTTVDPSGVAGTQGGSASSTSTATATVRTTTRWMAPTTTIRSSIIQRLTRPGLAARRGLCCQWTPSRNSICNRSSQPSTDGTPVPWSTSSPGRGRTIGTARRSSFCATALWTRGISSIPSHGSRYSKTTISEFPWAGRL